MDEENKISEKVTEETIELEKPVEQEVTGAVEPGEKMYTETQFNKAFAPRLRKEREKWEAEAEERKRRETLVVEEKLRLELLDAQGLVESLKSQTKNLELQLSLAGKVVDVKTVGKLAEAHHYTEEGEFLLEEFLKEYPYMALGPQSPGVPQQKVVSDKTDAQQKPAVKLDRTSYVV
jgi:hypothetical protein